MPRMEQFGPGLVPGQQLTVIGSGDLAHRILGLHDHWKLIGFVMAAQGPVTDKDGEKAGKAERVIIPDGLQVAPERLGPHIDAEDRLGLGRSEEHTSELQSRLHLVCRLLLEKKKNSHNDTSNASS